MLSHKACQLAPHEASPSLVDLCAADKCSIFWKIGLCKSVFARQQAESLLDKDEKKRRACQHIHSFALCLFLWWQLRLSSYFWPVLVTSGWHLWSWAGPELVDGGYLWCREFLYVTVADPLFVHVTVSTAVVSCQTDDWWCSCISYGVSCNSCVSIRKTQHMSRSLTSKLHCTPIENFLSFSWSVVQQHTFF